MDMASGDASMNVHMSCQCVRNHCTGDIGRRRPH